MSFCIIKLNWQIYSNSSGSIDKADVKQVISKPKINTQRLFEGKPGYSRYKDNQSEKYEDL